ncbi:putative oxidoreductase protein [Labilithrix luteola]|uniref:Putative oxidoreductase protein n=1 Tax=Labilithrix luteola TaxID=1391654 RepID=A0A0K1QFD9_9BACT|nr:aldo/keto reductase [Labilithrix luteola]AKV04491.1 putative oxidoreductase protein [Labilithrix luteola]
MLTRPIPKSNEQLPVVGLGTWQTFDVGTASRERSALARVATDFFRSGGTVIDSSPMYGGAEEVVGDLLAEPHVIPEGVRPFLATKVWTRGRQAGIDEMNRSMARMRTTTMDLMQVHNLVDADTHLPVLREWKQAGKIRYIGITHYAHSAFDELERRMRTDELDFVQLPYSIVDRAAEKRLLPVAQDTGTAVLVMRPFAEGQIFRRVHGKPLPDWASDFDCTSWSAFLLKFVLSHPAVTCPIPATANPSHLADNCRAGDGRLPDEATREKMARLFTI